MKTLSKKELKDIIKKIEGHKKAIGMHRDELSKIRCDLQGLDEDLDNGIRDLESACDTLSQTL